MKRRAIGSVALILTAIAVAATAIAWPALTGRHRSRADARIAYGADPRQHGELWLPKGKAKAVVLMIHGGCWRSSRAAADMMRPVADDLRRRGFAVWTVDYRGINQAPFPATFRDVAAGADALRGVAKRFGLDLRRVIAVGHSAGGHLALWLAARRAIAPSSPLTAADPLPIAAAVSLGGPPDLEADRLALPACGADAVPQLVGEPSDDRPDPYADTSPARLPQPAIPIVLISGGDDGIVPPALAQAYAERVRGPAKLITVPGTSHGDLVTPNTKAWRHAVAAIEAALPQASAARRVLVAQ